MGLETAKGTRDIYPEEMILLQSVVDSLRKNFELFGFNQLQTPILEKMSTLASKYTGGAEILKETFKVEDQGGRDLGLRYDLTVPFSRFIAMNPMMKMPFKRYEIGRIFRDGPIRLGRYREFTQCDCDIVGSKGLAADAECINLFLKCFKDLNLDIYVRVNNKKVLDCIGEIFAQEINKPLNEEDRSSIILALDKLDKIGVAGVNTELTDKFGKSASDVSTKIISTLKDCVNNFEKFETYVNETLKNKTEYFKEGLEELKTVINMFKGNKGVIFDPSLARGLAYYTGSIFEVYTKNSAMKSSVGSGGRYDKMIGNMLESKQEYPAIGISFGLDSILVALKLEKKIGTKKSVTEVYIVPINTVKESLELAQKLRDNNINTELDLNSKSISKNLDYANYYKIPYVIILGEDEIKKKKFKLKDMNAGKEQFLSEEEIIKELQ